MTRAINYIFLFFSFTILTSLNIEKTNASHLYGNVGPYQIEMELENHNGLLSGWLIYPGRSKKLNISGSLKKDGKITLRESNPKGKLTGVFNGRVITDSTIEGTFEKATKTKTLPFKFYFENNVFRIQRTKEKITSDTNTYWVYIIALLLICGFIFIIVYIKQNIGVKEIHYVNESTKNAIDGSYLKGKLFQEFVVKMFKNKDEYFDWLDAAPDIKYGRHYPKSNKNPDLIIQFKNDKQGWKEKIAVECKFRAGHKNNIVTIDKKHKLDNYLDFSKNEGIKTFMAIGLGGEPSKPQNLYVLPIEKVKTEMSIDELQLYRNKKDYFFFDFIDKKLK